MEGILVLRGWYSLFFIYPGQFNNPGIGKSMKKIGVFLLLAFLFCLSVNFIAGRIALKSAKALMTDRASVLERVVVD